MSGLKDSVTPLVRVQIPPLLWSLIVEAGKIIGVSPKAMLKQVILRLDWAVERGEVDFLGYEFPKALHKLQTAGKIVDLGHEPLTVDISKLHTAKLKSGYEGVYVNSSGGFSVRVTTSDGQLIQLGSNYKTALHAAQARYYYYQEHHLPYGELEVELAMNRKEHPQMSDADLLQLINDVRQARGKGPLEFPEDYKPRNVTGEALHAVGGLDEEFR